MNKDISEEILMNKIERQQRDRADFKEEEYKVIIYIYDI